MNVFLIDLVMLSLTQTTLLVAGFAWEADVGVVLWLAMLLPCSLAAFDRGCWLTGTPTLLLSDRGVGHASRVTAARFANLLLCVCVYNCNCSLTGMVTLFVSVLAGVRGAKHVFCGGGVAGFMPFAKFVFCLRAYDFSCSLIRDVRGALLLVISGMSDCSADCTASMGRESYLLDSVIGGGALVLGGCAFTEVR